jgi:hypothetical protein
MIQVQPWIPNSKHSVAFEIGCGYDSVYRSALGFS